MTSDTFYRGAMKRSSLKNTQKFPHEILSVSEDFFGGVIYSNIGKNQSKISAELKHVPLKWFISPKNRYISEHATYQLNPAINF